MTRLIIWLAIAAAWVAPGCAHPNARTIAAAVLDPTSGTAYAFEVDDSPNRDDFSVVIVCNAALPSICYRFTPQEGASAVEMPAIRRVLMSARRERVQGED